MPIFKRSAAPESQGGANVLGKIGLKTEAVQTPEELADRERIRQILNIYAFVRRQLDKAVYEYFRTGSFQEVEAIVDRPATDKLKAHLSGLRAQRTLWRQPERTERTEPRVRIVGSPELDARGRPVRFVVEERFIDRSVFEQPTPEGKWQQVAECPGHERVIQTTIVVEGERDYRISGVLRVQAGL
jgi:hypothetical protein